MSLVLKWVPVREKANILLLTEFGPQFEEGRGAHTRALLNSKPQSGEKGSGTHSVVYVHASYTHILSLCWPGYKIHTGLRGGERERVRLDTIRFCILIKNIFFKFIIFLCIDIIYKILKIKKNYLNIFLNKKYLKNNHYYNNKSKYLWVTRLDNENFFIYIIKSSIAIWKLFLFSTGTKSFNIDSKSRFRINIINFMYMFTCIYFW
jgi:hypothetical protein